MRRSGFKARRLFDLLAVALILTAVASTAISLPSPAVPPAMGKSILASDLDQIGQVLTPGLAVNALPTADPSPEVSEMAVLTPPGDHDGLIKGLQFLVERPAWRSVLGRNARREALARYTWEQHVAAIIDRLVTLSSVDYAGRTT